MSLKIQLISGIKWYSISQIIRQLLQLLTLIILTRLLPPGDFGLISMAAVITQFVTLFSDLGTSAALIQRQQLSQLLLSSIFWINFSIGCFSMIALLFASPLAAAFYNEPNIILPLSALSIIFLISSLGTLQQTLLSRELAFQKLAFIEMVSVLSGSSIAVLSAIHGAGIWSLISQALVTEITKLLLLWTSITWKPTLVFGWSEVRSVSHFGLHLTAYKIIDYFHLNADYLLIGRFLGAQNLGYYYLAYRIISLISQNVSAIVSRVLFPAFSRINDDAQLRLSYLSIVKLVSWVACPLMLGLMVLSEPLVMAVFGSKWTPIIPLLSILAPVGLSKSLGSTVGPIYQAKGRTDWLFYWGIIVTILVLIAFVIGLHWGIVGVATAYAATLPLAYPGFAIPFKLIQLPMSAFGQALWRSLLTSLLMAAVILGVKFLLPISLTPGWTLSILTFVGASTYLRLSWWLNREPLQQLLGLVRGKL